MHLFFLKDNSSTLDLLSDILQLFLFRISNYSDYRKNRYKALKANVAKYKNILIKQES